MNNGTGILMDSQSPEIHPTSLELLPTRSALGYSVYVKSMVRFGSG